VGDADIVQPFDNVLNYSSAHDALLGLGVVVLSGGRKLRQYRVDGGLDRLS
jgi:hypothetical protein